MLFSDLNPSYSRISSKDWEILITTARGLYVEVGTFHGASACAAAQNADKVITIDIYEWTPKLWEGRDEAKKIFPFKGTSADYEIQYLKGLNQKEIIDVLFIDGAHEGEGVSIDCQCLIPYVKKDGFVLFHDHNPHNPYTGVFGSVNAYLSTIPHQTFPKIEGTGNLFKIQKG